MMGTIGRIIAMLSMLASGLAGAQVLAPPPLPGQIDLARKIVHAFDTKDSAAYAALLADDVMVTENDKEVARNKTDWLRIFGRKLSADGVFFKLSPGFSSTGRLLFIEYFNSAGSWGSAIPKHCCWSYDAVAYDVVDGKVAAIRRLTGGDMRLKEDGRPEQ